MKSHLMYIFNRYDYPSDAAKKLVDAYDILEKNSEFIALVEKFYIKDATPARAEVEKIMDKISADSGVHPYTAKFLYYLCLSKELPQKYKEAGIPEEYMWEMLEDFRYKLTECLDVYGIPGFFANPWFYNFFTLKQFKLGRLEYELLPVRKQDIEIAGRIIKEGTEVINVHIPSEGGKFNREARLDSYKRAYEFFRDVMKKDIDVFICDSWLLYPANKQILPEKSNIVSFMDDFCIYASVDYSNPRYDLWRIYGADANKPYNELPRDNSLKRAYADWLEAGNPVGEGRGVFIWDNKNNTVITK